MRPKTTTTVVLLLLCATVLAPGQGSGQETAPAWELIHSPLPTAYGPAVMTGFEDRIVLASGPYLVSVNAATLQVPAGLITLPVAVDAHTRLSISEEHAYFLSGEGPPLFYRVNLSDGTIQILPLPANIPSTRRVLDVGDDHAYIASEGVPWEVFEMHLDTLVWRSLRGSGPAPEGQWARGLLVLDDRVLCWPDHHTRGYVLDENRWGAVSEFGVKPFRAFTHGGMIAADRDHGRAYITQGTNSRLLVEYRPELSKYFGLRPKLPLPLGKAANEHLFLTTIGGIQHLNVHYGSPTNKLARIPVSALQRITPDSSSADIGSPWTNNLPNGFRLYRTPDARGVMGTVDAGWIGSALYTVRRGWLRTFIHINGSWLHVRDLNLNEALLVNGQFPRMSAQTNDGPTRVYYLSGNGADFIRVDLFTSKIARLPYPPIPPDRIMAMTMRNGHPWLVVRDASGRRSLTLMEFDPASASWRVAARVPDDSDADAFLGLLAHSQNLELIHGNHLSNYDPVIDKVTSHTTLKLDMTADGGMAAQDDSTVYLIGARGSRSLMKLDLNTRLLSRIDAPFPNPVATYGNRAVVAPFGGEEILLIAGGNDSSELWSVPTSILPRLTLPPEGQ